MSVSLSCVHLALPCVRVGTLEVFYLLSVSLLHVLNVELVLPLELFECKSTFQEKHRT